MRVYGAATIWTSNFGFPATFVSFVLFESVAFPPFGATFAAGAGATFAAGAGAVPFLFLMRVFLWLIWPFVFFFLDSSSVDFKFELSVFTIKIILYY